MRCWLTIIALFFSTWLHAANHQAIVLTISDTINPATQDYFKRGLDTAIKQHADVVILQLNTPGGLESTMRHINEAIITSPIPIITYVAPAGARAASAGTFIMYASHLTAMAPGTNIGAASPIPITREIEMTASQQKAMNDAAAYMRSLAQLRGRNADWADLAVRKAASISATEAKRLKVIDEVANDLPQLLQKIDGHTAMVLGNSEAVKTKDLQLTIIKPDWQYQFLSFITNPNIAYILMLIAIYGLFFELSNPGLVLPGVAGIISLLLVLYAFQLMPINYVGLTLLLLGISFMIFEIYVSSFGIIGIGGVIAFVIGSIMLFDIQSNYHVDWLLIGFMSLITILFFFIFVTLAIRSHKKHVTTGQEGLLGTEGTVLSISDNHYKVRILGEIWDAQSPIPLFVDQEVIVEKTRGLVLIVKPKENKHPRRK